jgi:signal transduction histidine kinase
MSDSSRPPQSERVLVLAPFGRDGSLIEKELKVAGLSALVAGSAEALCEAIDAGAGAALIADEALSREAVDRLSATLRAQPPWSNLPVLVMTSGGEATEASRFRLRMLEPLGNVNLLERPLRPITLVSSIRAALRTRRQQYQLRAYLQEKELHELEMAGRNAELLKANRELEEFAYAASHDLQEPLRMINIYSQLLVQQFGDAQGAKAYTDFIEQGVKRMEKLLKDLLTFSRTIHPDALTEQPADLSRSFAQAVATLQPRIEECAAEIHACSLPVVMADEAQMGQVFQNLLSNALKYRCRIGTPQIDVCAVQKGEDWEISVRDNGIGFEPQFAERIFGLFKRLHKDEYPGTGLGLAICQRIVERWGGHIWAEGRPGEGSTFSFTLPAS